MKVIVQFLTGEEKKGDIMVFNVKNPTFPLQVEKEDGTSEMHTVKMDSTKAIYFLKKEELSKTSLRVETMEKSQYAGTVAFKLTVEFKDGEVLHGTTLKYSPNDKGFYLIPLTPSDKSDRVYINAMAVKNVEQKMLMGKILVNQQKITPEQLEKSIAIQKKNREKKIGTIFVEKEFIGEEELQIALDKQEIEHILLGEILLEAGYITPDQLEHTVLIQQKNREKKLGQILVELKYLTPNDICMALATQFNLPWIDLSSVKIPVEIVTSLPYELMRRLKVIPVERKGSDNLVVATSEPEVHDVISEINRITGLTVELVIAYEEYIEAAINLYFPVKK